MSKDELISREEALVGLPAKRANTLLFLIENQTAHFVARSRVEFSLTDSREQSRDLAFLEAFALGNGLPLRPTIQHLERYAPQWRFLVPENPRLKAALICALSQKYNFTHNVIPNICTALGLDEEVVEQAFLRQYRKPLSVVFASQLSLKEQLCWNASVFAQRLESLPPFWIAFLITVANGLPQAFLALPIACADLGIVATVILLVIVGTVNILTMACMAEAIGRSGDFRYGNASVKQLVANLLGDIGSFILSFAVGIRVFFIALACYIGLSATMANLTPIPAPIWATGLFCGGIYLVTRKSLSFTVSIIVLLAAINIGLLLLLALLALPHLKLNNLLYINLPIVSGQGINLQMLHQVLGVILMLYFGHVYVGECAKLVLPKDKSATSLIWGSVAGTGFLTFLFCLWVLAINGAIAPQVLANQSGTALEPLTQEVGYSIKVLGVVLVILLLGMAWIRSSSLLVSLTREWLPIKPQPILMLGKKQGRLILQPRSNSVSFPRIGVTYLGIAEKEAKFRFDIQGNGSIHSVEIKVNKCWNIKNLLDRFPELNQRGINLILEVESVKDESVCIKVASSMAIAYEGNIEATSANNKIAKSRKYEWASLLSVSPLLLVFLLTEWLFLAGIQSFTSILGFAGVLGNSVVGGIFPVLILASSRRKGELIPGVVFKFLNHPLLLVGIYSFFLANLFLHGLFIWENSIARASAVGLAVISLGTTLVIQRSGAFSERTVVELHQGTELRTTFNITVGGEPKKARVYLGYVEGERQYQAATVEVSSFSELRYAIFQLPAKQMEELKMWAHKDKLNGECESIPGVLEVSGGNKIMQYDLKLSGGQVLLPAIADGCCLKIIPCGRC